MEKIELIEAIGGTIPLYVRYNVGCKIFGMSQREFEILADKAGAIHKVGKMNLVNTVVFNVILSISLYTFFSRMFELRYIL